MTDTGTVLKVADTYQSKIDNFGRLLKTIIYFTITGGFSLILQQQLSNPNSISRSFLIISNCLVFIGTYLYFTVIFFYEDITRNNVIGLLFIVIFVILTMIFTLLPNNKKEWKLLKDQDGLVSPKETTLRKTDEELIILSVILFIPVLIFSILLLSSYYSPN